MPHSFPLQPFEDFKAAADALFPAPLSDGDFDDPLRRRLHYYFAWRAVLHRYRTCAESSAEFDEIVRNPSELSAAGWHDEEFEYKSERCIFTFFVSALAIFESFSYCLYFVGEKIRPEPFTKVQKRRQITPEETARAFSKAFPHAPITESLKALLLDDTFHRVDGFRNVLAHRLTGARSRSENSTLHEDGTSTVDFSSDKYHLPGEPYSIGFGIGMLECN